MPPPPFKALKGAAVKLLACRTRGPGINPGLDSSNSVIVYLLLLFLCVIQFGRDNGGGAGVNNAPFRSIWPMVFVILNKGPNGQ